MKMKTFIVSIAFAASASVFAAGNAASRPVPSPALKARIDSRCDVIGIVHWGLNTYTDREWGFGEAAELLGCVNWLLDDSAAGFVTGTTVPVDGGFLASAGV